MMAKVTYKEGKVFVNGVELKPVVKVTQDKGRPEGNEADLPATRGHNPKGFGLESRAVREKGVIRRRDGGILGGAQRDSEATELGDCQEQNEAGERFNDEMGIA